MKLVEKIQVILNQNRLSVENYIVWYKRFEKVYSKSDYKKVLSVGRNQLSLNEQKLLEIEIMEQLLTDDEKKQRSKVEEFKLIELINQGKTTKEIASFFGVHQGTIKHYKRKLGYGEGKPQKKYTDEQLRDLLNKGYTIPKIANILGVSESSITKRKRKL